jgi:hypothetical protein
MGFYNVPLNHTVLTEANRDLIPYMYSCLIRCQYCEVQLCVVLFYAISCLVYCGGFLANP